MDSSARHPPTSSEGLIALGVPIALRDGSRVRIRPVRRSDSELLLRGFRRLSPESRYRRFLTPTPELSKTTVRYLTDVDHHDHEAMIALGERSKEGVGVARYVRHPARPEAAELAVTVIDEWQGRGLGTLLLEAISLRAREEGIDTFTALMLVENNQMMDLLKQLGAVRTVDRAAGTGVRSTPDWPGSLRAARSSAVQRGRAPGARSRSSRARATASPRLWASSLA
jgi:GNAT superfamily N-acetyltransferase